jgi:hypothetical protein
MLDELVDQVIARLKAASEFVFDKREKISRESGLENVRKQREHALVHPHLSSTTLPEALFRANNVLSRLEREAAPLVKTATAALLAVEQAAREVKAVETAINNTRAVERAGSVAGLYKEAVRVVDKLAEYGAKKWVLRQQSATEIRIYADLMRWKARDHDHVDPNSPWQMVFAGYRDRQMDVEVDPADRYGTSMPQQVADALAAKHQASIRPTLDLSIRPPVHSEPPRVAIDDTKAVRSPAQAEPSTPEFPLSPVPPANEERLAMPSAEGGTGPVPNIGDAPPPPVAAATFYDIALAIAAEDGIDDALWREVGFPGGSAAYEEIVRKGEAAIAGGSTIPHLADFVEAARKRYPSLFLGDLRKERATRLAEVLATDPTERARYRAKGFDLPGD